MYDVFNYRRRSRRLIFSAYELDGYVLNRIFKDRCFFEVATSAGAP